MRLLAALLVVVALVCGTSALKLNRVMRNRAVSLEHARNAADDEFLDCVFKDKTMDNCYYKCYHKISNIIGPRGDQQRAELSEELGAPSLPTAYDRPKYKSAGIETINAMKPTYEAKDWKKNVIGTEITDANIASGYLQFFRAGAPTPNANLANNIRISLQISPAHTPEKRSEYLWKVVKHMVDTTQPRWLKIDTPGQERVDSILLAYQDDDKEARKAKYQQVCTETQKPEISIALGANLPVFQYKASTCQYASVSDYFKGKSFGQELCTKAVAATSKDAFKASWAAAKHPTSEAWDFDDPTD